MKKLLIGVGILIVLAVVAVAALPFVVDVNKYRPRIQSELQKRTGRAVSLGKMELKVYPLRFRVENALIGEDPNFPNAKPFASAQELFVEAKLMPLLSGDMQVDEITLNKPVIELIRNQQGVWNFTSLGKTPIKPGTTLPGQTPPAPQPGTPNPQPQQTTASEFRLAELVVIDGQVAITDFQKKQPRAVYDHIDLRMEDIAPNKAVSFDLAAHLPGTGKETIRLKGKGGPMQDNVILTDLNGTLEMEEVSLAGLKRFVSSQALEGVDFIATGKMDIENKAGVAKSSGTLTLANANVNGVNVGYPISADFNVNADLNRDFIDINKGQLKLGQTPLNITGTVNNAPTPAIVDLAVKAGNASISEAARLAAAFGVAFNPGMDIKGRLDADLKATGSAKNPALNGTLAAKELVISGKDLPQAVQVTGVNLALSPQAIRSNEFVASTGTTAVRVNFTLTDYTAAASNIDARISAPNAQLGELLNIANAYGVSAVDGMSGTGPVSIDVSVKGPTKRPAALMYAGNGKLTNASLNIPAFTQPLKVRNADLRFTQNAVSLENLTFAMGTTNANGQAQLNGLAPGASPSIQFSLNADKLDVVEWQGLMKNQPTVVPSKTARSWSLIPSAHAQKKASAPVDPLITRLSGGGTLQVQQISYGELQMTNGRGNVTFDRGVIRISPLTAQSYGGTTSGVITVDTRPTPSVYTVSTKINGVDANQLLSATSSIKRTVYGLLMANADTSFQSSGNADPAATARSMNGKVSLNLSNGKIANIDMLYQLAAIGKFLQGGQKTEPFTNVSKLTGDFDIKNGVAFTNNLLAQIDNGSLAGKGSVDLANQTIDMQVTAVMSKTFTDLVGGTGVGGYLSTALANTKGELVIPVNVRGSMSSPKVEPDLKRLAQMRLENALPSAANPAQGILGVLLGGKGQPQTNPNDPNAPQQPQQKGGLSGIIDALGGKTPEEAKPQTDQNKQDAPPPGGQTDQTQQQQPATQKKQGLGGLVDILTQQQPKKKTQPKQDPPPQQQQQQQTQDAPPPA